MGNQESIKVAETRLRFKKFVPFFLLHSANITEEKGVGRLIRFSIQTHARFLKGVVAFLGVASLAGCYKIGP
jgi:hypothetical protein